ncbi:MAG: lytic murein transglycosylase [Gaiellaceae bacterium]
MKRLLFLLAVLAATAAPPTAGAQVFRVVSPAPAASLPSYQVPNAPSSIVLPFALSNPPAHPETLAYGELVALWQEAGAAYGVPWQVLGAINKIESNFGGNMGPSSAGALGWMQFIPDTWMRWGMDADGDGVANPWDPQDAVFAAARYLAAAGAHEDIERAIFAYNHANWYVEDVLELAALFGDDPFSFGSPDLVFAAADLEQRMADARALVAEAGAGIARAEGRLGELGWKRLQAERRAGNPDLSDSEFHRAEARVARLVASQEALQARIDRLRAEQAEAVAALEALREEQSAAAFSPSLAGGFGGEEIGDYVFPVGGGPERVSVAHTHHDYPAADIAAPQGSPLYALTDAVVTDSYPEGNGKCGIGFKLRTESGVVFVYCHLSYLEPHIVPGAALGAGAPVGLVGSTGNSTGPHLHLAFDPAVAYPQEEPWFESFAGRAFSWQDAPTPERPSLAAPKRATPTGGARVFRVVQPQVIHFTR